MGGIIAKYDDTATDLICAGILHDTIEDTGTSPELLKHLFGGKVAELVSSETEDKNKSWEERKRHTIEHLANARQEIQVIASADKLRTGS